MANVSADKILEITSEIADAPQGIMFYLNKINKLCAEAITVETVKKKGGTTLIKRRNAVLKYLKDAPKRTNVLDGHRAYSVGGKLMISDGYTFALLNEMLDGVECAEESEFTQRMLDQLEKSSSEAEQHGLCFDAGECLAFLADCKTAIAQNKATEIRKKKDSPFFFTTSDGAESGINPKFYVELDTILGGIQSVTFPENVTRPILVRSDHGVGLICPIKVKE